MLGHIWISNDFNVILQRNRKIHHGVVSHIHRVVNSHGILCPLLGSMSGPIEMIHQQTATDYQGSFPIIPKTPVLWLRNPAPVENRCLIPCFFFTISTKVEQDFATIYSTSVVSDTPSFDS